MRVNFREYEPAEAVGRDPSGEGRVVSEKQQQRGRALLIRHSSFDVLHSPFFVRYAS
jgi:hypothetical protein